MSAQLVARGFVIAWRGAPVAAPLPAVGKDQRHWRVYTRGRRAQAWQRTVIAASSSVNLTPGTATLSLTGPAPTIAASGNVALVPGTAAVTLTGNAPTVLAGGNVSLIPGTASVVLTGPAPVIAAGASVSLVPGTASLSLTGAAPTLAVGGNVSLTPGTAQLSITGFSPVINAGVTLVAATPGYVGGQMATTFSKDPGESIVVAFDFSSVTSSVLTPSPVQIFVCASLAGGDSNPGALLSGPCGIDPNNPARVLQRVAVGGSNLTDYELKCYASDANGEEILRVIVIQVRTR